MTTASVEQNTKPEIQIKCEVDGCEKQFKTVLGLNAHKLAKHSNNSSNPIEYWSKYADSLILVD